MKIGDLFQLPITRRVNPIIQVEDQDEAELRAEISEYVVTGQIANYFVSVIDKHYLDKETSDIAIWISGFFGSGKSLFLKLLSMVVAHETVGGQPIIDSLVDASDDGDFKRALKAVGNGKPACAVLMHMKSEAFVDATIVGLLWRKMHEVFGYSRIPWVAEMERSLEKSGLRKAFEDRVTENTGRAWAELRNDPLLRGTVLGKALAEVDSRYPNQAAAEVAISEAKESAKEIQAPLQFTKRCLELLNEHPEYSRIFFGLDEMGQFAADRSDLLLELASIVEQFSSQGRGKLWLAATAQERLDVVVENFAGVKDLIEKIRDRFPKGLRIELSKENAEQVVRERLLRKTSEKRQVLEAFLRPHESWLQTEPVFKGLKRDYKLPTLPAVVDTYPFLPAHFQVITDFMQGLARDTGGTADRTARTPRALIAVTQDIAKELAEHDIGALVRADHIYEHMQGSIPSEDTDVVKELNRVGDAPSKAPATLRATYVLDQIGVDQLPATAENIYRSLIEKVGASSAPLSDAILDALVVLTKRTFVREVGSGENVTYRFLKDYQRKIEAEVHLQDPSSHELQDKSTEIMRQALKRLVPSQKASFKGVRTFGVGFPIDDEFLAGEPDIRINVYSPMKRRIPDDDARERSVTEHQVYWVPSDVPQYLEEVRVLVATNSVLERRSTKATTEEERSQLRRAREDLDTRDARLLARATDALRNGTIYLEGTELAVPAQPGEAIVEEVVERRYPSLWRAPVRVDERDLEAVFASNRPTSGPLCDLGLVAKGQFSDASELAKAVVSAVQLLEFKGGASGDRIIVELQKAPHGYADMQTRLAVSVLCAQGKLKAIAPGGAVVAIGNGLEQRLRVTSDFRKTVFEREAEVDPLELHAVSNLLQQHFDKNVGYDVPLVARDMRAVCQTLLAQINQIEARVRDDVPQVIVHLASLKLAVVSVLDARSDGALVKAVIAHQAAFDRWQATIKPVADQLDAEGVAAVVEARALVSSPAVEKIASQNVSRLRSLIDGPQPWQDLKQIRQLRGEIAARVRVELEALHQEMNSRVDGMEDRIRGAAAQANSSPAVLDRAIADAEVLRCLAFAPTESGVCKTCRGGVAELRDRVDATDKRLETILLQLTSVPETPAQEGGAPADGKVGGPRLGLSVNKEMRLPRVLASDSDVAIFVQDLKTKLEHAIAEYGSTTVIS